MTALPDVKLRVVTNLPASIRSGPGASVTKANGVYSFALDFGTIQQSEFVPADEYAVTRQLYWNSVTNSYVTIPYTLPTAKVVSLSGTSATIATGDLSFTVDPGLGWIVGTRLRGTDNDDPTNWIEGVVKSYDPLSGAVTITVDSTVGSGTISNWSIGIAAEPQSGASLTADTMSFAQSFNVKTSVSSIVLNGWYAKGDKAAGSLWLLVGTAPTDKPYFTTANGKIFELTTSEVRPGMCGAKGDGATDDTDALKAWLAYPASRKGDPGYYVVSAQLNVVGSSRIDWNSMIIDASAGTPSSFGTRRAVVNTEGALTQLPDLSSSPPAAYNQLPFASAHGLVEGDVGIIYNPTNSSYSNAYTYARAGEFFTVETVMTSVRVKLYGGLIDDYLAANIDLYKMAKLVVDWSGLHVIAPNTGFVRPVSIRLATRILFNGVTARGSDYVGIDLDRCHNGDFYGCGVEVAVQATDSKYGVSIGNSQGIRFHGGEFNSVRHAFNVGGDDYLCCVPCRDINISHAILRNDSAFTGVPVADVHANVDGIRYQSCVIYGAGSFNGKNNFYDDCDFIFADAAVSALIAGGDYWLGGTASVTNSRFRATPSVNYSNGMVRLFTSAANTAFDSTLVAYGNTFEMASTTVLFRVDHYNTSKKANINIGINTIISGSSLTNILYATGDGTLSDYVYVERIAGAINGATIYSKGGSFATSKLRLFEQSGVVNVTPVSGNAEASASVVFPLSYGSGTPGVMVTPQASAVNSKTIAGSAGSITGTGFNATIRTGDSSSMGVTSPVVPCSWSARVG